MIDTIRIRTKDEQTARSLASDQLARFHPELIPGSEGWNLVLETDSETELPDLLEILNDQLRAPDRSFEVLFNGEPYTPRARP